MGAGGYFMEVPWALPMGLHWVDQKTHFQEGRGKKPGIASLYKSCSGTILGFNDYGWKSGIPIE
jgi:hypothetical protein